MKRLAHLRLLADKLEQQVVSNDDDVEQYFKDELDPNKAISSKAITHKKVAGMLGKARADGALKKKGHAPKYLP